MSERMSEWARPGLIDRLLSDRDDLRVRGGEEEGLARDVPIVLMGICFLYRTSK